MNNLDKIISRIEDDARHDIELIAGDANVKCGQIRKKYEQQADFQYTSICSAGQKEAEFRRSRLESTAKMESSKRILAEKQALISEAFEYTVKKLLRLPPEKYIEFMSRLIASAAGGEEEVIFSPEDREKYGAVIVEKANSLRRSEDLPGHLSLSSETRHIRGGAVLKRGKIELNCSFDALIEGSREELCGEVAKILFD